MADNTLLAITLNLARFFRKGKKHSQIRQHGTWNRIRIHLPRSSCYANHVRAVPFCSIAYCWKFEREDFDKAYAHFMALSNWTMYVADYINHLRTVQPRHLKKKQVVGYWVAQYSPIRDKQCTYTASHTLCTRTSMYLLSIHIQKEYDSAKSHVEHIHEPPS